MPECIKYFYSPSPASATDPIFAPFLSQHILLTQFSHFYFFIQNLHHFLPLCTFCSSILYHSFQTSTFSWSPAGRSGVSGAMDELSVPLLLDPPTPPHRVQPNRISSSSQLQFLCHFLQVRERITFWSLATQTGKQKYGWEHCQRHNGPEGSVHITSSYTNLNQISSSESRLRINFSTKHQHLQ